MGSGGREIILFLSRVTNPSQIGAMGAKAGRNKSLPSGLGGQGELIWMMLCPS